VAIGLPHHLHSQVFLDALAAGKHVICEKPLSTTPADLYKMAAAAQKSSQITSGIFQHRYSPVSIILARTLAEGVWGKVKEVDIPFTCERTPAYYAKSPWRGTWAQEGGGTLINQAIHTLDTMVHLLGMPSALKGQVARKRMQDIEVEDFGEAQFYYPDFTANFKAQNIEGGGWNGRVRVLAENGHFSMTTGGQHKIKELALTNDTVYQEIIVATQQDAALWQKTPTKSCYGSYHQLQFADFIEAIQHKRAPLVTVQDAARANELVLGIYHSAATQNKITWPLTKYQPPLLELQP
jgi:predicted dehydrogenase